MADLLQVTMEDGTTVLFQDSSAVTLVSQRGGPPAVEELAEHLASLECLADGAAALCKTLVDRISPDEIEVELGAGLSGEVGWFFAKSSLDATIKVTLTWKKPDTTPTP